MAAKTHLIAMTDNCQDIDMTLFFIIFWNFSLYDLLGLTHHSHHKPSVISFSLFISSYFTTGSTVVSMGLITDDLFYIDYVSCVDYVSKLIQFIVILTVLKSQDAMLQLYIKGSCGKSNDLCGVDSLKNILQKSTDL